MTSFFSRRIFYSRNTFIYSTFNPQKYTMAKKLKTFFSCGTELQAHYYRVPPPAQDYILLRRIHNL